MATKAEIKAKIQENLTLNSDKVSRTEHESFLHTESASILESIYEEAIKETNTVNSVSVPVTANMIYETEISKVGRMVTVFLNVVNTSAGFLSGTPFKITDVSGNQYLASISQLINYQLFDSFGNPARVTISATATETSFDIQTIPQNTSFKGVIIYNAAN